MPNIVSSIGRIVAIRRAANTVNRVSMDADWPGDPGDSGHPPNGGIGSPSI